MQKLWREVRRFSQTIKMHLLKFLTVSAEIVCCLYDAAHKWKTKQNKKN